MGTNIQFGTYSPDEDLQTVLQLTLGVFFDGTLNNRRNTYIRKEKEKKKKGLSYDKEAVDDDPFWFGKDSYENDYSNIARMADYYMLGEKLAVYIEGAGTKDGEGDTFIGYTTGTGTTGVREKVRSACEKIAKKIGKDKKLYLILDVFGFSRGAAGARNFVHEITKSAYKATQTLSSGKRFVYKDSFGKEVNSENLPRFGHLGYLLKQQNVDVESIEIRFVGLYDTVSSYGFDFGDDTADLNLDSLSNRRVKNVVQLAASDEWREKFNRTNISSAGDKGREYLIPGAHSDVGGCYESETSQQSFKVDGFNAEGAKNALKGKESLIQSGWYTEKQLEIKKQIITTSNVTKYSIQGKRYIDNRYSYITLHLMCQLASEKNAEFNMIELNKINNFPIPSKLADGKQHILDYVKQKLQAYIEAVKKVSPEKRKDIRYQDYLDFTKEKVLRNNYIHWSATGKVGHGGRSENKRRIKTG